MYYLLLDGAQSGPYSLGQLIEMWQAHRVDALTLYWEQGNADWLPLHNIAPLLQVPEPAAVPPPTPGSPVFAPAADEQVVWSGRPTLWFWTGELFWGVLLSVVLIGIPFLIHVFWARNTTRFRVTTRRVSVESRAFSPAARASCASPTSAASPPAPICSASATSSSPPRPAPTRKFPSGACATPSGCAIWSSNCRTGRADDQRALRARIPKAVAAAA